MISVLFWNIARKRLLSSVVMLCREYDADIIFLAESPFTDDELLRSLNEGVERRFFQGLNVNRIKVYFRLPRNCINFIWDSRYCSMVEVDTIVDGKILLCGIHLPSKLHEEGIDQAMHATSVAAAISAKEDARNNYRTLVIGDFNMNPFEVGLVAHKAFHAVMDRSIAERGERVVHGDSKRFFYNPMWNMFGDGEGRAVGTHFFSGGEVSYFWNMFDQVLIRSGLLPNYRDENLAVVDLVNGLDLADEDQNPDGVVSDHKPVWIKLIVGA